MPRRSSSFEKGARKSETSMFESLREKLLECAARLDPVITDRRKVMDHVRQAIKAILDCDAFLDETPPPDFLESGEEEFFEGLRESGHRDLLNKEVQAVIDFYSEAVRKKASLDEALNIVTEHLSAKRQRTMPEKLTPVHEINRDGSLKEKITAAVWNHFAQGNEYFVNNAAFSQEMDCVREYPRLILIDLINAGFLKQEGQKRTTRYSLTEKGRQKLAERFHHEGIPAAA